MARKRYELNVKGLNHLKPGRHADGGGLFFNNVAPTNRHWESKRSINGKQRWMGLGSYPEVSLQEARERNEDARRRARAGVDPITERDQARQKTASARTVRQAAEEWLEVKSKGWNDVSYPEQIRRQLQKWAWPLIGHLPIAEIGLSEIKQVLMPIWVEMQTSTQIRGSLEAIIDWAAAEGYRDSELRNPAAFKLLRQVLPQVKYKLKHYDSLPYEKAPDLLRELRGLEGMKYLVLEFIMLMVPRVSDLRGGNKTYSVPMLWKHVDLDSATWTLPDTKSNRPHLAPLSSAAVDVLKRARPFRDRSDIVFPGRFAGNPIGHITLSQTLTNMGYGDIVSPHGFRATFRTWASEETDMPTDIIEAALAHTQGKLDAAYHRGSFLQRRRVLMQSWADYLEGRASNVVALRA